MPLHRKLLMLAILAAVIPYVVQAQEKQRKFEINVGISTPGMIELQDTKLFNIGIESFDSYYYDKPLSGLDKDVYTHAAYPCFSVEMAYKLAESGFFKRLDLVGLLSLHSSLYEKLDKVNRTTSEQETARKLGILIGIRYNILKKDNFNMYTQFIAGGDIRDKSRFWDDMSERWSESGAPTMQFTFLGFNYNLGGGDSGFGTMLELGFGSEYAGGIIFPLVPGVRAGFSYRF